MTPDNTQLDHKTVEDFLLKLPNSKLAYPFGEEAAVYKVNGKMFAIIQEGKTPVRISLKCDPILAETLRKKYDSVMPGYHLNKKYWNTIVLSGQLEWPAVQDLIKHSYDLVARENKP